MNPKSLVKLSNIVGAISIVLLIYWIFVFVCVEVFGLKVFRENITQTFNLSILGILALMFGALITNIMFNLTRIAQKINQDQEIIPKNNSKIGIWVFAASFPVIIGLLFGGDYLTSQKKEKMLIQLAKSVIEGNIEKSAKLLNYSFSEKWIIETGDILDILSKTDENFPHVLVIVRDSIDKSNVFLGFRHYYESLKDTIQPKKNFILETTQVERDYLNRVFDGKLTEVRFNAHDGNYELYYPYSKNNKKIVLHFSDYQRYGKNGS
ncbi:MAG: peptidase [Verrucomicrobia bacterium]|nr:peptidase [Cytophagales bacterium]